VSPPAVDPAAVAGALSGLRALDKLAQLTPDDLRRLAAFLTANVEQVRGASFVDAIVAAAAEHGLTPPAAGADPVAWLDQHLAAIARALGLVFNARGELG
jgi:hypothetical protein